MKKLLFIIALFLLFLTLNSCVQNKNMGVGVLYFRIQNPVKLQHNRGIDSVWMNDNQDIETSFSTGVLPFETEITPATVYFRILEEKNNQLLIVWNEEPKKTLWVKKEEYFVILNWIDFLNSFDALSIGWKTKLKASPSDSVKNIEQINCGAYEAVQLRGNWLEVKSIDNCFDGYGVGQTEYKEISGWVRWTDGEKLLVTRQRNE